MEKRVRFSLNPDAKPTLPDAHPSVKYGVLDETAGLIFSQDTHYKRGEVRMLPPCWPSKIVCVGRNYRDHAKELNNPVPAEPLIFLKPPSSLVASGDPVVYPAISQLVNYEGELGVVIGRVARHLTLDNALDAVAGYTCVNDVTARDLQKRDGQFTRGKGFDTFCPAGPWIVPAAGVDLATLRVTTYLNGELKQDAPVSDMIFPIPEILVFISRVMTLEPGDLIATGTPAGVGALVPGDTVRVEIPGIGVLENTIVAE